MTSRLPGLAAAILWTLGATLPAPVLANTTGPTGGYGPTTVCVAGYALAARDDEAVVLHPGGPLFLLNDQLGTLQAHPESGPPEEREFKASTLIVPETGTVTKHDYPTQDRMRAGIPGEMVGVHEPMHTEYLLPAVGDALPVRLMSPGFTGGAADRAVLRRFTPKGPATRCDPLRNEETGKWVQDVIQWSPVRTPGPFFACRNGLGFAVRGDEHVIHTWPGLPGGVSFLRIDGPGYQFDVFGARAPKAGRKPMGGLLAMGYRIIPDGARATLWPPATYPRDPKDSGQVFVRSTGLDEAALATMIGRIEYVRPGDKRCRAAGK